MFSGICSAIARSGLLCKRAIVLAGLALVLGGCDEETCREMIPDMIKKQLAQSYPCESRWPLGVSYELDLYSPLCLHELQNNPHYTFHCGQHQYFSQQELHNFCIMGLLLYELECQAKEQKLSRHGPRPRRVPSPEMASVD